MAVKFLLSQPITAFGKEITEIELKKPNCGTLRRAGYPFKWETTRSGTRMQLIDAESMANYISELAGIPPSSVDNITAGDALALSTVIIDFFEVPSPEKSSSVTSSSAGSSET
jgi:hypothetical protein